MTVLDRRETLSVLEDLTHVEAEAIARARSAPRLLRDGIVPAAELASGQVRALTLAGEGAERVVPACVAALGDDLRRALSRYVRDLGEREHRGWFFALGASLGEDELERLRPRCREICEAIGSALRDAEERPKRIAAAGAVEVDVYWSFLRGLPTAGNPACRAAGCAAPSIGPSVHCARHHYEAMVGKAPPGG